MKMLLHVISCSHFYFNLADFTPLLIKSCVLRSRFFIVADRSYAFYQRILFSLLLSRRAPYNDILLDLLAHICA